MTDPALDIEAQALTEAARAFMRAADELLKTAAVVRSNDRQRARQFVREAQHHTNRAATCLRHAEEANTK